MTINADCVSGPDTERKRKMKALVIYTSQTGFTKRYAGWLAEELGGEAVDLNDVKNASEERFSEYDTIVYGGWANAGKIVRAEWFLKKAPSWKDKKLAVFCVGAAKAGDQNMRNALNKALDTEQKKYIGIFYLPGGMNYEKLKAGSRLLMKAYAAMLKKKPETQEYGEMISKSFDMSDRKYLEPVLKYLGNTD